MRDAVFHGRSASFFVIFVVTGKTAAGPRNIFRNLQAIRGNMIDSIKEAVSVMRKQVLPWNSGKQKHLLKRVE